MAIHFRRTARGVGARGLAPVGAPRLGGPLGPRGRKRGPVRRVRPERSSTSLPGAAKASSCASMRGSFPALLALKPEEGATVSDWPVTPGVRRSFHLVRHEVWAEDAKVFRVDARGRTEIPRSSLVFFWGSDTEGAGARVGRRRRPAERARSWRSSTGPTGVHELARDASDAAGRHLLAAPVRPEGATARCAQEDFPDTASLPASVAGRAAQGRTAAVLGSLYKGILAIDTDKEYLASFSNNTTTTTNYIATLVANINVMYERDLNLRLLVGTTILRVGSDPWTQTGSRRELQPAERVHELLEHELPEVRDAALGRGFLLREEHVRELSGIAWVTGSVCGNGNDYSFNQISGNGSWLWGDTLIVGHEIGHNMGSPHTHCYPNPAPDRC